MFSKIRLFTKLPQVQYESNFVAQTLKRMSSSSDQPAKGIEEQVSAPSSTSEIKTEDVIEKVNSIPLDEHSQKPSIVDINIEDMMEDDAEFGSILKMPKHNLIEASLLNSTDIDGANIAPVDINPWIDEEELVEGTVDMENIEKDKKPIEYPPIPEIRNTTFKFKGIQIRLPRSMLGKATYRYRMDEEDEALADDIRICKFT